MNREAKLTLAVIALVGPLAQHPGSAEAAHAHHFHHATTKAGSAERGTNNKGVNPQGKASSSPIDLGATPLPPQSTATPNKTREVKPSALAKPENFPAHQVQPSNPIGRNAIGQPVGPPAGAHPAELHFGPAAAAPQTPQHAVSTVTSSRDAKVGQQNFQPIAGVNLPSHSKIDGAGLIRPSLAVSGLGGPAKTTAGINGTAFRPKH